MRAGTTCAKAPPSSKAAATGRSNEFTTVGRSGADATWAGRTIRLRSRRPAPQSDYSVTDEQIKLSKLQGKLFGGTFTGDAQVENWLHSIPLQPAGKAKKGGENLPVITATRPPPRKVRKPKLPGVQSGAVHLRLRDVSAGEVSVALDVPAHPLRQFHPAGSGIWHRGRGMERIAQGC